MNTTQPKTPGYNSRIEVFISTDKRGRQIAHRMSAGRAIRMSLADALVFVATDAADLLPGNPFKSI